MRDTDFFDQFTRFIEWVGDLLGRGIESPKHVFTLLDKIRDHIDVYLSDFVHPMFLPLITAMIAIALLHKCFRMGDKE